MKPYLFLALILLSVNCFSQQTADSLNKTAKQRAEHELFVNSIIQKQAVIKGIAAKPTGSGQRLMSASTTRSGILVDSLSYTWGGNRETEYGINPNVLYSGGRNFYPFSPQVNFYPYTGNRYYHQKPDSVKRYSIHGGVLSLQAIDINGYNTGDELIKYETYNYPSGYGSYMNISYGATGEIIQVDQYNDTSMGYTGNYALYQTLYCNYNGAGKLVKDSLVDVFAGNATIHQYFQNSSGEDILILVSFFNLHTGVTHPYLKSYLEYHANGFIKSLKTYDVSTSIPITSDSFEYTGSNTYPTYYRFIFYNSVGNIGLLEDQFTRFDANGYLQEILTTDSNVVLSRWDTSSRQSVTYNSANNPVLVSTDMYFSGWQYNVEQKQFYYQNSTSVRNIPATVHLNLFPNPTSSIINLQVAHHDHAVITIRDIQGRLVQQYSMGGNSLKMNLEHLPSGHYVIQYKSDSRIGVSEVVKH